MNEKTLLIRKAKLDDLAALKVIGDANREALGFLLKPKLEEAIKANRILVASHNESVAGFVIFRHRKTDLQTTLSDICVHASLRRYGIGTKLLEALKAECLERSRQVIQLKCPADLEANKFYRRLGFRHTGTEKGRSRNLNIWQFILSPEPQL